MAQRFAGKVALATGSTQGVGEALLQLMADEPPVPPAEFGP